MRDEDRSKETSMKPMISPNGKEGAGSFSPPALHLVRLPGEFGPILRCLGPLTVATREALRRELTLLETLNHPVLTLNLAGCVSLDVDGILTVLESCRRQRDKGRRLVVVAGKGAVARLLRVMGMDWVLPVFPTEDEAALALRAGWPSLPGPETWTQAQAESVVRWQVIHEALGEEQRDEVLRLLTSMTALCERSEEIRQGRQAFGAVGLTPQEEASVPRCQFCPLFDALGGQPEDIGCRSLLDPIIAAVNAGDTTAAGAQVLAVIEILRKIRLPTGDRVSPDGADVEDTSCVMR
jgi:anti-anti-sigma factor